MWLLLAAAQADAATDDLCPETLSRDCFGASATLVPLPASATNAALREVRLDGQTAGWLFRTDQIPPAARGKRGEIVLLVALGADTRIKGLRVLGHREDAAYFGRLKPTFFAQFNNRRADAGTEGLDAVTKATLSSRAIIREVAEGAKNVLSLPEVAAKIRAGPDCPLTRTAAVSHN